MSLSPIKNQEEKYPFVGMGIFKGTLSEGCAPERAANVSKP